MEMAKISKKAHLISKMLTTHQLTRIRESDIELNLGDFLEREPQKRGTPFFLGFYSKSGLKLALKKYGVFEELKKRGFRDVQLEINTNEPFQQRLSFYQKEKNKKNVLIEVVLKRKHLTTYSPFPSNIHGRSFEFLCVEWLAMQDPRAKFTMDRPRLPGQEYPGLRSGRLAAELLALSCKRLRLAGILNVPEFFHNAQMYSKTFHFLNPEFEGKRIAIQNLLETYRLADVSWAIDLECIKENDKPFKWFVSEHIMPLDRDLQNYFSSLQYQKAVKEAAKKYNYALDTRCWEKKKSKIKNFN
jgi:hypothetical protein